MRSILAALAALALLLTPTLALAAISTPTLIASGSQSTGVAVTTTVDAPIGSLIVVMADSKGAAVSCTTNGSDALTLGAGITSSAQAAVAIYYISNSAHDLPIGSTFTCTTTTGGYDLRAYKVSGAALGVDGSVTNSGGSVTTLTATTAALASNREIAFGATSTHASATSWVEASGFTYLAGQGAPDDNFDFSYQILNSAAAVTYTTSWSGSTGASVAVATFKAPAVSGHTLGLMGIGVAANDNHPLQELRLAAR